MASNLSTVLALSIVVSPKAHLAHVSALTGRSARIRPVIRPAGRVHARFPAAFRPPALASWAILFPPQRSAFSRSTHRLRPDQDGVSTFHMRKTPDRGGCRLYPGAAVFSATGQVPRSPPAASQRPALAPRSRNHLPGLTLTRRHHGSLTFTRPAFPSPAVPGWNEDPWAFPRASHPAVTSDARQVGTGHRTLTRTTRHQRHRRPPNQRRHSLHMRPRVAPHTCTAVRQRRPAEAPDSIEGD